MNLDRRTAKIGNAIPSRSEQHGDESVTALDIPLSEIMLDEREFCEIMGEPLAHNSLYNKRNSGLAEPLFRRIKPLALTEKIEGATIVITHGVGDESIKLAPVKVAKIKLEPCSGGLTSMQCTIQCTPDLNESVAKLLGRLNSTVDIELDGGDFGKQADLPLNSFGDESNDPEFREVG